MINVLLVDPDCASRDLIMGMLDWAKLGYIVHSPEQGTFDEILRAVEKQQYALVIINLKPFSTFSLQLCENIREISQIPIILIGGSKDFHIVRKAIALRVNDYLPDPFTADDLRSSLSNLRDETMMLQTPKVQKGQSTSTIIEMVKRYVQDQMHQNITLKKISDMLHFNCAYLGQKFKRHENMTFNEYLLQQRMERAKKLLAETDMRIYEIANRVGYSEVDWFYKKFKEYTGESANEYRKKYSYTA